MKLDDKKMTLDKLRTLVPYIDVEENGEVYLDGYPVYEMEPAFVIEALAALPDLIAAAELLSEIAHDLDKYGITSDEAMGRAEAILKRLGVE